MGSQEPSVRIYPEYQETDGYDAIKIMKIGGIVLDPWQQDTLCDWMSRKKDSLWASPACGCSVPRQNGKTGVIQARCGAGMLLFNEWIVYTAHLQKTATETFEELAALFDSAKFRSRIKDIKTALGRERIILKNGAQIKFLARTRNGGRGQHGDLLIFDEAQALEESQQASFLPAISASINPQTIYAGTPPGPDDSGCVFRDIRTKVLNKEINRMSWVEYSVDDIGDIKDKNRWYDTNPALGRRMLESTVANECEQMPEDTFARERLGWWSSVEENKETPAIDIKAWDKCSSNMSKPEGKTAYGVKFTADGAMVALAGAVIPEEGKPRITLIEYKSTAQGTRWLAEWLNERYKKASCVVIDGRNGVDLLIDRISEVWKIKNSVVRPTAKSMVAAVSMLSESINENTVTWYKYQEILDNSARNSVKRPIAGGWGFGGENSAPVEAASLALWGAKTSKRNPLRKMRIG